MIGTRFRLPDGAIALPNQTLLREKLEFSQTRTVLSLWLDRAHFELNLPPKFLTIAFLCAIRVAG